MSNIEDFIKNLSSISADLDAVRRKSLAYWYPEKPPETIILAEMGAKIADIATTIDSKTANAIFKMIEFAVLSKDEHLSTVVATGLVEGIVDRAETIGTWNNIKLLLGPHTIEHASGWSEWKAR